MGWIKTRRAPSLSIVPQPNPAVFDSFEEVKCPRCAYPEAYNISDIHSRIISEILCPICGYKEVAWCGMGWNKPQEEPTIGMIGWSEISQPGSHIRSCTDGEHRSTFVAEVLGSQEKYKWAFFSVPDAEGVWHKVFFFGEPSRHERLNSQDRFVVKRRTL